MRLIDADELERKVRWYGGNTAGLIPHYELINAPTVKAIPIEWLDRYVCNITKEEKLVIDKMFIKWVGEENETN